jgi:phage terminase large subunit-like protein
LPTYGNIGAMTTRTRPKRRATFRAPATDLFDRYTQRMPSRRARAFIEAECIVPMGRGQGKRYELRPTHRRWLREAFDHKALSVIISGPRGMGKTGWMAAVAVWALYDRPGAQVIIASTSLGRAMKAYTRAVRIIEASPRLEEQAMVYRNAASPWVELPARGAQLTPMTAEEKYLVGEAPSLVLIDEVGYVTSSTWEALQTSLGKDPSSSSTLVAFGTPGLGVVDTDSTPNMMWAMRRLARSERPPADLRYVEHAARPTDDPSDRRTWKRAYGELLGDLVEARAVAHDYATLAPARFGQMRLGLWTQHETAWMPVDAWDAMAIDTRPLDPGAVVSLGFDGSISRDSTALVALEDATGRLVVLGHWPGAGTPVPRGEVMATIERAFADYTVTVMLADPWHWRLELEQLRQHLGERVMEWNTASIARMGPASDAFLAAVLTGELCWDGTPELRAHALNAVAKRTAAGDVIARDARRPAATDLATAAILAYEARRTWAPEPTPAIW